jgi:hypothetical protein
MLSDYGLSGQKTPEERKKRVTFFNRHSAISADSSDVPLAPRP